MCIRDRAADKVSKKLEEKINQKLDEATDSSTVEKILDKIQELGPFALHQEHIAHMQLGGYQIVGNIFIATLYAQHVDAETLAQVGICLLYTSRIWQTILMNYIET